MRRAIALLLLGACACASGPAEQRSGPPACRATTILSEGQHIPADCAFEKLDGGTVRLAELAGTPAVLNFWASWCAYCIEEMPALERANRRYAGRVRFIGADLLGVDAETRASAERFVAKTGIAYTTILDRGGLLAAHFTVRLVPPMTIFVDANGVVRYRKFGPLDVAGLTATIRTYLGVS